MMINRPLAFVKEWLANGTLTGRKRWLVSEDALRAFLMHGDGIGNARSPVCD